MDKHNGNDLASFFPPPSLPMHDFSSPSGTQPPMSPSSLQNQLTMSMFGNMLNSDQLGQGSNTPAQCNPQTLLEQQFKLAQLQQLQQLQNQIFQQQIALISGQSLLSSTSPPKDQGSSASATQLPYPGLLTPGPSTEIRPRETTMEYVSPIILNSQSSFLDAPLSTQQNHHPFQHHHEHSFSYSQPHNFTVHPHTAPPQMAFHIQSNIPSQHDHHHQHHHDGSSPMFNSNTNPPPSSTLSVMTGTDLDISPITSPLFGPAGNQQHSQHDGSHHPHTRSASFSHHPSSSSSLRGKRPADDNDNGNGGGDAMGGVRKRQSISLWDNSNSNSNSNSTRPSQSQPQSQAIHHSHHSLTPLTLLPQSSSLTPSPLISPTSPMLSGNNNDNNNKIPSSNSSSSSARRRMYRGSKSVTNTPLLTGQRSRMNSITRGQGQGQGQGVNSATNAGINFHVSDVEIGSGNMNSMVGMDMGVGMGGIGGMGVGMGMGVGVGDTPSPVDLDMSMPPPPAHPESSSSSSSASSSNPNLTHRHNDNNNSGGNGSANSSMGMGMGGMGMMGLEGIGGEGRLLPVTPASIMKLGRLSSGNGNGISGFIGQVEDQGQGQGQMEEVGQRRDGSEERKKEVYENEKEQEKEKEKEKKKEKEKIKEKEKQKNGGVSGVGLANGRTRRAAAVAATSNITGMGLKAILPSNPAELNISNSTSNMNNQQPPRKTSHKAAEQKRRDSLKSTFDDLRTLLPVIPLLSDADDGNSNNNIGIPGAWPPRSSSLLPGSLPPRGPPKSGTEGPNKGVSKLQLLVCGNEFIRVLKARVERRDEEINKLRMEVGRLRGLVGGSGSGSGNDDGIFENLDLDLDLDLERDLDAVELKVQERREIEMGVLGGLGSVGEQPELEEEAE